MVDIAGGTQLGLPAPKVIEDLYDLRDGHAATMLYLWGLPIVAMAQLQRAHREVLGGGDFDLGAYLSYDDKLGILTPNTVTPYYMAFADLGCTGPLVINVPAGPTAGGASDFWQQTIVDMGQTGPDKGLAAATCSSARNRMHRRRTVTISDVPGPTTYGSRYGC